jgi:hypothetical protein
MSPSRRQPFEPLPPVITAKLAAQAANVAFLWRAFWRLHKVQLRVFSKALGIDLKC